MKFEEVKKSQTTRNGDVIELCSEFLKSGFEVAEVTDWNERYSSAGNMYTGFKNVITGYFKDKIKVVKNGNHIYLERLGK